MNPDCLLYTEQSKDFDKSECISIILDTSTLAHAENTSYRSSRPEDIYIFDHHEKPVGTPSIEEELLLPKENIFRNLYDFAPSKCLVEIPNLVLLVKF